MQFIRCSRLKWLKGDQMSKQYPECPLYAHTNCKELENEKICAIVRKDKICLKKKNKNNKQK
jgi:hypothetical protein